MRISPIVFIKEYIYKAPQHYKYEEVPFGINVIDFLNRKSLNGIIVDKNIYEYCIFRIRKGYKGIGLLNTENNELMGYAFFTTNIPPPTNIPKLPKESAWLFNDYIFDKYRGFGLQKILISERLKRLKRNNPEINVYTDILEKNYPSRKSYLKMNFEEVGIYYIFVLSIRRFRFFNIKLGYWSKNKQHRKF